jgi:hypothetical protein
MTEASPIRPACAKGEEGEVEVGVGVKGERLTAELPEKTMNHQLCVVIPRNSGMI